MSSNMKTDSCTFVSTAAEATYAYGRALGACLQDGDVVLLKGDLGAGKTCFSQGVARGLAIEADVVSPTFTIMIEYTDGHIPLYHFDLYRLDDESQLEDIDFYYMVDTRTPGACLIEWADRFPNEMPDEYLEVDIKAGHERFFNDLEDPFAMSCEGMDAQRFEDDLGMQRDARTIDARALGERFVDVLAAWRQALLSGSCGEDDSFYAGQLQIWKPQTDMGQ